MPYFTKKGTGKDKGKTCVYKKEDKTKVGCTDGPVEKYLAALHMNESDDLFGWTKEIKADLKPGEIYDIKTGNGYYWVPELYYGREYDKEMGGEVYKFGDIDSKKPNSRKSVNYVRSLIEKGDLRPYNPNWSIRDEITFTNDIRQASRKSFVIYFENGIMLDDTLPIQDKLFEMGFQFYTKGPNEYITNENTQIGDKLIQFFECVNWNNDIPRYQYLPNDQWDNKMIMLRTVDVDALMSFRRPDNRMRDQELFLETLENDVIVINGDNVLKQLKSDKKDLNETAGISTESREWANIIHDVIMSNPDEKERLIIDGYDYPEVFNSFPIDYVVVDFYDKLTGYGQEYSGYDEDGNYVVVLYIQPQLLSGVNQYSLKSALNHEMKHAWEDYNRRSKGLPSIDNTKESKELYNRDFILMLSDNNVRGPIKEILKYYYYLSKLERSAYLENVYDGNNSYEKVVREVASKDFEEFKDRFDLGVNWYLVNSNYNIPFLTKFKNPNDFIEYSAKDLRSKAVKILKKINKMKYIHGKI